MVIYNIKITPHWGEWPLLVELAVAFLFIRQSSIKPNMRYLLGSIYKAEYALGPVYLSRLNLQQTVWYLGKTEPM